MRSVFVIVPLALTLATVPNAGAYDVTTCHQRVPTGQVGVLQTDLTCTDAGGPNVTLSQRATLLLNGHTISGGYIGVASDPGPGRVTIEGPGDIMGAGGETFGAAIAPSGRAVIRDVVLHDNQRGIVTVYDFALKLENVTIVDNAKEGISSYFVNQGSFIGPGKGQITARSVTVSNNGGDGIRAYGKLDLRESTISGNGDDGVQSAGPRFALDTVTVTGNGGAGLLHGSRRSDKIKGSTLTGNGPDGDIAGPLAPRLFESTCEHSVSTVGGGTLGICSGD